MDVAIVGGGIAGLTAATLLKEAGHTVAVLEAGRILQGVTGFTTAKLTSLHTLIYDHLIRTFGEDKARAYGEANQAAIEQVATLVQAKGIDCDFARTVAYTYTESPDEVDAIRAEVRAAFKLGLPAEFVEESPLPFPIQGAVRFNHQARFHPRKYLLALAQGIPGQGSHILEQTRVMDIADGEPCLVTTERGTVQARDVIIASHFPFNDKSLYATRLEPHRSYVLAVRLQGPAPQGMFITPDSSHTLRSHPDANGELVLVGGEGHKTGEGGDTIARYQRVEQWAHERLAVRSIEYRWSTQDNRTIDRVPYIGLATPTTWHVYVATGFGGWGMTNGTVAGMLLRDLIAGRENPWAEVYNPNRVTLKSVPTFAKQNIQVAGHLVGDRLSILEPGTLAPGEGKTVLTPEGEMAVYRDEQSKLHMLSAACTHMGCLVEWNPAEKSWDCPCHGSRFALDGSVLHGPAITPLEKKNTSELIAK